MTGLVAGAPVRAGGRVVIPVERVWLHAGARWAAGGREPVAVVIVDGAGPRAVDIHGDETALEPLLAEASGLAAALGDGAAGGEG